MLERGKLTKEIALLLEAEEKEAKKGDWKFGTREAVLSQGGRGRPLSSPFHPLLLSPAFPTISLPALCLPLPPLEPSIGRKEGTPDQKVAVDLAFHSGHMTF